MAVSHPQASSVNAQTVAGQGSHFASRVELTTDEPRQLAEIPEVCRSALLRTRLEFLAEIAWDVVPP